MLDVRHKYFFELDIPINLPIFPLLKNLNGREELQKSLLYYDAIILRVKANLCRFEQNLTINGT